MEKISLNLLPLNKEDLHNLDSSGFVIPDDVLQLQADAINVLEGVVPISSFDPEYQKKIKSYYRFSAFRQNSKQQNSAKRTRNTLEII
jgi:hypothetical protein